MINKMIELLEESVFEERKITILHTTPMSTFYCEYIPTNVNITTSLEIYSEFNTVTLKKIDNANIEFVINELDKVELIYVIYENEKYEIKF